MGYSKFSYYRSSYKGKKNHDVCSRFFKIIEYQIFIKGRIV